VALAAVSLQEPNASALRLIYSTQILKFDETLVIRDAKMRSQ